MTEPWGSRKELGLALPPTTKEVPDDGRAMSMGSTSRKLYDKNGKADYRDTSVFLDGQSPTSKSHSK